MQQFVSVKDLLRHHEGRVARSTGAPAPVFLAASKLGSRRASAVSAREVALLVRDGRRPLRQKVKPANPKTPLSTAMISERTQAGAVRPVSAGSGASRIPSGAA
jgi:hypothetical protein